MQTKNSITFNEIDWACINPNSAANYDFKAGTLYIIIDGVFNYNPYIDG